MVQLSSILVITGIVLIILGLLAGGKLGPLGKLPGDIQISYFLAF